MDNSEIEKAIPAITVGIVEYVANSVVKKTILKKLTGNISAYSFDNGEGWAERTTPFDNYLQIIEGKAEIVVSGVSHTLQMGESIVIPAHASISIKPNDRFKMIVTVIKSAYE